MKMSSYTFVGNGLSCVSVEKSEKIESKVVVQVSVRSGGLLSLKKDPFQMGYVLDTKFCGASLLMTQEDVDLSFLIELEHQSNMSGVFLNSFVIHGLQDKCVFTDLGFTVMILLFCGIPYGSFEGKLNVQTRGGSGSAYFAEDSADKRLTFRHSSVEHWHLLSMFGGYYWYNMPRLCPIVSPTGVPISDGVEWMEDIMFKSCSKLMACASSPGLWLECGRRLVTEFNRGSTLVDDARYSEIWKDIIPFGLSAKRAKNPFLKGPCMLMSTSGVGKTFGAGTGLWKDGDTLVDWPVLTVPAWWEDEKFDKLGLGVGHLKLLYKFAVENKATVAFAPVVAALSNLLSQDAHFGVICAIWIPHPWWLYRNLSLRKEGCGQPTAKEFEAVWLGARELYVLAANYELDIYFGPLATQIHIPSHDD